MNSIIEEQKSITEEQKCSEHSLRFRVRKIPEKYERKNCQSSLTVFECYGSLRVSKHPIAANFVLQRLISDRRNKCIFMING